MSQEASPSGHRRAGVALALLAVVLGATLLSSREPSARPETAPSEVFSAARARLVLQRLVGDGIPHPVGSAQQGIVRDRVLAELRGLGLVPTVERDLACSRGGACAWVENIVAALAGREPGKAVVLNAHYDSVPAGPGAGDDGAGVAALVEIARALRALPRPRHAVVFLVDDGEEVGLLGAEAFVKRHGAADSAAVLVLEARGSSGRTLMFETNPRNRAIVEAYARSVARPTTSSVFFSLYERLPNSTNFTTFKREGMKGMALGFIGDPAHYHTPLNRLENVPGGTLQDLGDTGLAVAREIAERGLVDPGGNASYFDLFSLGVVRWPESWNAPLAIVAILLLATLAVLQVRAKAVRAGELAACVALGPISLAVAGLLGFAITKLAGVRLDGALWPASGAWLDVAAWSAAFAVIALLGAALRGRVTEGAAWSAVFLDAALLGLAVAFVLPGAAYLVTLPALAAGVLGAISWARVRKVDAAATLVPLVLGAVLVLPIATHLLEGMGAGLVPGLAVLVAMVVLPLTPLLVGAGAAAPRLAGLAAVASAVSVGALFVVPVYSAAVPRPLCFVYQMERGGGAGHWLLDMEGKTVPSALAKAVEWKEESIPSLGVGRNKGAARRIAAVAPPLEVSFPEARVVSIEPRGKRSVLWLALRSPRGAAVLRLRLGRQFDPRLLSVGNAAADQSRANGVLTFHTVPPEGVVVAVEIDAAAEGSDLAVDDETPGLPPSGEALLRARPETAVPQHRGDRTVLSSISRVPPLRARL